MKKIFIGLAALAVASCSYYMKGDYTLGKRNTFNDFFYTYNIRYYDTDEFSSVEKETETVSDYEAGVVRHAVPGGIVVSSKVFEKEVYSDEIVRPTKKGALVSYTVPVQFSDEQVYKIIGEVEINEHISRRVEPNRFGDIVLLDGNGNIYPRVGRIYNDRLALLETAFQLEPEDLKFQNELKSRSGEEDMLSSFEVRYAGIEDYKMVFKYKTVVPNNGMPLEENKTYKFPMYDKNVNIGTIKIEVLGADESGIEYKVLAL